MKKLAALFTPSPAKILMTAGLVSLFTLLCSAQSTYTVLHNFRTAPDGGYPMGSLTISGNVLYGMTTQEGATGNGSIFSIDTNGNNYKVLLSFNDTNGSAPWGALTISGNKLYGMTTVASVTDYGNVFSINTDGSGFKTLLLFNGTNGKSPEGSLILIGSRLYGTADGGAYDSGCVFSIDTNGNNYKKLFDFTKINGVFPVGSLTLVGENLYGMTNGGGINNDGVIYSIDSNGSNYKKLLDFNGINGKHPTAGSSLTYAPGIFYGITPAGGVNQEGCIFSIDTNGGKYKDLFDCTVGTATSYGSLTLAGNKLYGMTPGSGLGFGDGTIFSIDTNGGNSLKLLSNLNGVRSFGSLIYASGTLYGMTEDGGLGMAGVVFKIDTDAIDTDGILGTNDLSTSTGIMNVYPNPSNGQFTFDFTMPVNGTIEIYDITGKMIHQQTAQSERTEINLSGQSDGMYFYRVLNSTGSLIGEGKILKE